MKLRHNVQNAVRLALIGTAAAAVPGVAFAGSTIGNMQDTQAGGTNVTFGYSFNDANGNNIIDDASEYRCPTGYTCSTSTAITDAGFIQVQLTDNATGEQYFQTIITDASTTAGNPNTFADESFVKMNAVEGGLANQQKISSFEGGTAGSTTPLLDSTVELKTGDFGANMMNQATTGGANLKVYINQGVTDGKIGGFSSDMTFKHGMQMVPTSAGMKMGMFAMLGVNQSTPDADFTSTFRFNQLSYEDMNENESVTASMNALNAKTGLHIATDVGLGDPSSIQNFQLDQVFGQAVSTSGTVTMVGGDGAGSTTSWAAGGVLMSTQVQQAVSGAGVFGFQDATGGSDPATAGTIQSVSLTETGPFAGYNNGGVSANAFPFTF